MELSSTNPKPAARKYCNCYDILIKNIFLIFIKFKAINYRRKHLETKIDLDFFRSVESSLVHVVVVQVITPRVLSFITELKCF